MALTGAQTKQIHQALLSGFDFDGLFMLVAFDLDERLDHLVSQKSSLSKVVLDLIEWADRTGRLSDLLRAAYQNRPQNPLVEAVATQLLTREAPVTTGAAVYNGIHRGRLRAALLEQFPTRSDLAMLLDDTLSEDIEALVSSASNNTEVAFHLSKWLGMDIHQRFRTFLSEAIQRRPSASEFKALYTELFG